MSPSIRHGIFFFLKLAILGLFFLPFEERAMALGELFNLYDSPQGLSMGGAFTADATGYASNYYNPAGLAKASSKKWEIIPVDFEGILSLAGVARNWGAKSFGISRLAPELASHPGKYDYFRGTFIPSITHRNFGLSVLGSYRCAAQSDGTNIDIDAAEDLGPTFGFAYSFWQNRIKLGLAARALIRNQLKGTYVVSSISSDDAVKANMKEGLGLGADLGLLFTWPTRYLPTLGVVAHDLGNTSFHTSHVLNPQSAGTPDPIRQSFDAAFSIHPILFKGVKGTIAAEMQHIERGDLSLRKRSHLGFAAETTSGFFFWAGLNQYYPTAGIGYHVRGGDLEIGTYSEDIGDPTTNREDRRFLLRYTIGF